MWKNSVKYLGVWLCSGKRLQCDINSRPTIRKFYAAANSIFSHSGSISEMSELHLVQNRRLSTNNWLYLENGTR